MTFLELVNAARRECGANNGNSPLLSLGGVLSYENTRFKSWVNEAWREIQRKHRQWGFMERDFSFNTTVGVQQYTAATLSTPIASFANWKRDSFRIYVTATGFSDEQILGLEDLQVFRNLYVFGTNRTLQQRPVLFAIDTQKRILLGPVPDLVYTVVGQYYKAADDLVADGEEPAFEDEFHDLIVYKVMQKYGMYEAASEVLARGETEGGRLMAQLEADFLPKITFGPTLAT